MKTVFEIVTIFYEILNVDQVNDLLTGEVWRNKKGENDQGKCVAIVPLVHMNPKDIVKQGVMNVNIHAPALSNNQVDENSLDEILKAVVEQLQAFTATDYTILEVGDHGLVTDEREQTYVNLRVNYFCES